MSEKIVIFDTGDLALWQALWAGKPYTISDGMGDADDTLRMSAHNWERLDADAWAAMQEVEWLRIYDFADDWRTTEGWVGKPVEGY